MTDQVTHYAHHVNVAGALVVVGAVLLAVLVDYAIARLQLRLEERRNRRAIQAARRAEFIARVSDTEVAR